jgi:hypothetical protein
MPPALVLVHWKLNTETWLFVLVRVTFPAAARYDESRAEENISPTEDAPPPITYCTLL